VTAHSKLATTLLTIAFLTGTLASCAGAARHQGQRHVVLGEAADSFPSETLSDWKTYALQIAVVHVTSDSRLPGHAEPGEPGPPDIGRTAHLVVDRNLWVAPGFAPRSEMDIVVAGWRIDHGVEIESAIEDSPRIEPGDILVIPFSQYEDGSMTPLSTHAMVPIRADIPAHSDAPDPAVSALAGKTYDEMAALIAAAQIDPEAAPYMKLKPFERVRAVRGGS